MSLILKGIDMPKHCEAVEVKFYISDIDVYRYTYTECHREVSAVFNGEGLDNIIQIPKGHGRLIDESNWTTHEVLEPMGNGQYEEVEVAYKGDIDNAPTILEAEEIE